MKTTGSKRIEHPHNSVDCLSSRDGQLYVEDCNATELAARFGTPLYVVSERQLRENVSRFRGAFEQAWTDGPVDLLPAMKANTSLATRQILSEEGCGADIYSPEELHGVLLSGVEPALVSVNGGGKEREHIRRCIDAGVRITVEDVHEIDLIESVAREIDRRATIRLRVKPAMPNLWRRTDFSQLSVPIDIGFQVYKSGIPVEYLIDLGRKALASPYIEMTGIHFHAGRHHPSLWYWLGMMKRYGRLIAELSKAWGDWQPQEIDIGGGWPSPRDPHNQEFPRSEFVATMAGYPALLALRGLGERIYHRIIAKVVPALTSHSPRRNPPAIGDFASAAVTALRQELVRGDIPTRGVRLQIEPGRSLYGDTGIHLTKIKVVKTQTRPIPYTWVLTDTTVFFLTGGVLEHNRHPVVAATRMDETADLTADVVGQSCYADQIVLAENLPRVQAGDVLAILETGAYQDSSASNFNALPRPATVLVHGSDAEIIKRAETVDDVYARDIVPERLSTGQSTAEVTRS